MHPTKLLPSFLFASRWLQAPLYFGLVLAQAFFVWQFMVELGHLAHGFFADTPLSEADVVLVVLGLIDIVMIANLLIMVIVGGYETFVSRLHLDEHPDQPEWLNHVNAGNLPEHTLQWQVIIHLVFIFSALAMAWVDKIMTQTLILQHQQDH